MDKEDKEIEGPDLAREQQWEEAQVERHEEEELPEAVTETVRDASFEMRSRMFDALRLILAGEQVNVTLFYLPQREAHALEALQAAVTGNDSMGEFVYAEDRKALLEQSLAVLQQNLTYGDTSQIAELQSKFDAMSTQVGELREQLSIKEDAQEDLEEWHNARMLQHAGEAGDTDDKPKPPADGLDEGGGRGRVGAGKGGGAAETARASRDDVDAATTKSSTLAGEERPVPVWKSALADGGPEAQHPAKPSTLAGEPRPVPVWKSALAEGGPEATHPPKPSALYEDRDLPSDEIIGMHDGAPQRRVVKARPTDVKKDA